jgi:hypothetical protein
MTVNLAEQLESIFRAESDLRGELSPFAASPLDEPAAGRIRRIVANASPAVRIALRQHAAKTQRPPTDDQVDSTCVEDHIGLRSTSRMVDRSLEQRGAQA